MVRGLLVSLFLLLPLAATAQIARFVGDYAGSAEVETWDGEIVQRDMSVSITGTGDGFEVKWSSTTWRDGKGKSKTYRIGFVPTDRDSVFAAAMARNVFGHAVPLDPMKGEPYVWARIEGDTLTVFSMYVGPNGGYEIQQFDRTLVPEGLRLDFAASGDGKPRREVSTVLKRQ
ncbi:MAG: hypothetical protein KDK24_19150 [Pseudooceanicola sp.]|nr:hypothetical protein [Pseudooceanicola sp.]